MNRQKSDTADESAVAGGQLERSSRGDAGAAPLVLGWQLRSRRSGAGLSRCPEPGTKPGFEAGAWQRALGGSGTGSAAGQCWGSRGSVHPSFSLQKMWLFHNKSNSPSLNFVKGLGVWKTTDFHTRIGVVFSFLKIVSIFSQQLDQL